jgi:hypothetical protein
VVHVPPPEVVVEGSRCGFFARLFGHKCCDHCCGAAPTAAPTTASVLTPMTTTHTLSAYGFNVGATNLAVAGLGLGGTSVGTGVLSASPTLTLAANPALQQMTAAQTEQTGAFEGLRAIHAAEVRTAAIVAARAQQDAELRATMAALERAKGTMAAAASVTDGGSSATAKGLAEATAANVATTAVIAQKFEQLDQQLQLLEKKVSDVTKLMGAMDQRLDAMDKRIPTPPAGSRGGGDTPPQR